MGGAPIRRVGPHPAATPGTNPAVSRIVDPGLRFDHPRQVVHRVLAGFDTVTWYARGRRTEQVLDHVLGRLGLSRDRLLSSEAGLAIDAERTVLLIGLTSGATSSVTVFGAHGGEPRHGAQRAAPVVEVRIHRGEVLADSPALAAEVAAHINGAEVAPLRPAGLTRPGSRQPYCSR